MTSRFQHDPWFTQPVPNPAASLRLFCLPYAGGGASVFVPWARALAGTAIDVCPVQLPGREHRINDAPFSSMAPLVDALSVAIRPLLNTPYALFGHSMGATVAFELTRALRHLQQPLPRHLLVSGVEAPDVPDPQEPLAGIVDDGAFVSAIASRYGGVPQIVLDNDELRSLIVPALRADIALHETYRYREDAPVPVDLTAYGGRHDDMVSDASLRRWAHHTSGTFACRFFDGGHFFLHESRDAVIKDVIARLT